MLNLRSLESIREAVRARDVTVRKIVEQYLSAIAEGQSLNAFIEVYEEEALARADAIDADIARGGWKPFYGAVVGNKDVIVVKDHKVSAASKILEGFESLYSATAIRKLEEAGAIIIGRLNCDEFAMGSSNENSVYGPVHNAIDFARVPGGSSGGSAVAVQAGMCTVALGSDTGGSVRQPASYCGVVGMKPSYGRVSRYGLIAYASSFDQIGVFANNVEDAARTLTCISGPDEFDATVLQESFPDFDISDMNPGKRNIACFSEVLNNEALDPEIREATLTMIEKLKDEGHSVDMVEFPDLRYVVPAYYILTTAEASSNLARYDGVHFGYRAPEAESIEEVYTLSRSQGFGKEVKRRILLGTFVLSSGYYDAYYTRAQKMRKLLVDKTNEILKSYDFIISPSTPVTAFKLGDKTDDPVAMYLNDIYTVHANLTGLPAISLPFGTHSNGMPFGLQVTGQYKGEQELLEFSAFLESIING